MNISIKLNQHVDISAANGCRMDNINTGCSDLYNVRMFKVEEAKDVVYNFYSESSLIASHPQPRWKMYVLLDMFSKTQLLYCSVN